MTAVVGAAAMGALAVVAVRSLFAAATVGAARRRARNDCTIEKRATGAVRRFGSSLRAERGAMAHQFARLRRAVLGSRRSDEHSYLALLDGLGRALRSGAGIHQALREAGGNPSTAPLQFASVVDAADHGVVLADALRVWRDERDEPEAALVAAVIGLALDSGGTIERAVDRAAATIRESLAVKREARALATQAITSAVVVALAPLFFAALAILAEPDVGAFLFTTPAGWLCILGGLALEAIGAAWMAHLVRRVS